MINEKNKPPKEPEDSGIISLDDQMGFNPFSSFDSIFDTLRKQFDSFSPFRLTPLPLKPNNPLQKRFRPPRVDLIENEDHYKVLADLPGYSKKDLDIEVYEDRLLLSGKHQTETENQEENYLHKERHHQQFQRLIRLPTKIKPDDVKAKVENGILELILPKQVPSIKEAPHKIRFDSEP